MAKLSAAEQLKQERTVFQERTYNKRMPWSEASRGCDPAFAKMVHDWGLEMQRLMADGIPFDKVIEPVMKKFGIDQLPEPEQHRAFLVLERGWKYYESLVEWRMARAEKPDKSKKSNRRK